LSDKFKISQRGVAVGDQNVIPPSSKEVGAPSPELALTTEDPYREFLFHHLCHLLGLHRIKAVGKIRLSPTKEANDAEAGFPICPLLREPLTRASEP
jgi:hypothetical protein